MQNIRFMRNLNDSVNLTFDRLQKSASIPDLDILSELEHWLEVLEQDPGIKGLVLYSESNDFFLTVGAELILTLSTKEKAAALSYRLSTLCNRIANLKFPTVAAIHGHIAGIGVELALACRWRLATRTSTFSMPQVSLGFNPMAGGCHRLPELIGMQPALDLILSSRTIDAKKAQACGLIDSCTLTHRLLAEAQTLATKPKLKSALPAQLLPRWATEGNLISRRVLHKKYHDQIEERVKGQFEAPYQTLDAIFEGVELKTEKRLDLDARIFSELAFSRPCQNLIHLFLANPKQQPLGSTFDPERPIAILGANAVSATVASLCADANLAVRLWDQSSEALSLALDRCQRYFLQKLDRRQITPEQKQDRMLAIACDTINAGLTQVEVILESAGEDADEKIRRLKSTPLADGVLYASLTSSISPSFITEKAEKSTPIIGFNFFTTEKHPQLCEVILPSNIAQTAIDKAVSWINHLGLIPLLVKDSPGFFITRVIAFYLNEALMLIKNQEATIKSIDTSLKTFGFRIGPFEMMDEVGLDYLQNIFTNLQPSFSSRLVFSDLLDQMVKSGRLGKKNGRGFFLYSKNQEAVLDPSLKKQLPIRDDLSSLSAEEIIKRCVLTLAEEAKRCLDEGVVADEASADLGVVLSLGFPKVWGGPIKYLSQH